MLYPVAIMDWQGEIPAPEQLAQNVFCNLAVLPRQPQTRTSTELIGYSGVFAFNPAISFPALALASRPRPKSSAMARLAAVGVSAFSSV